MLTRLLTVASAAALARASLLVEPWGRDALRVRLAPSEAPTDIPSALLVPPLGRALPHADAARGGITYVNGNLRLDVLGARHVFSRVADGATLLALERADFGPPAAFHTLPSLTARFSVGGAEVFGLGQQREACYPEGGAQTPPLQRVFAAGGVATLDLARGEGGAANSLPWLVGATVGRVAEWGAWLNVPAMGSVSFDARDDANRTAEWALAAAAQLDYVVTTTPAGASADTSFFDLLQNFVSWVGAAPLLPDWALGYWHSKNRYRSQEELLDAARGFHNRSVPVDIIVVDWMHWRVQGDWHFDNESWPDPSAMVAELAAMGTRVMVTVWPWTHNGSLTYDTMLANGWLVQAVNGTSTPDGGACPAGELCPPGIVTMPDSLHGALVDVTNPAARAYVWGRVLDGYVSHGIEVLWLDASEPEYYVFPQWGQVHWQNATFGDASFPEGGTFAEMGMMFTSYWTQTFADGMRALGAPAVLLARAGYAGTWRNGAALWSGDIHCTWPVLQAQLRTGLSAQTSGFGLWTTDIGGFIDDGSAAKCDPAAGWYRELIVRWFQYGALSPIFRQHGTRATEIWAYGPEAEATIAGIITWRASIKPYLQQQMRQLNATGRPVNRPLWWDFPADATAWSVDDEFMFGDTYLAAPVVTAGAVSRSVYLPRLGPAGDGLWKHAFSGQTYAGGQSHDVAAPLDALPLLFERA